jgi:hypothetical protein
MTPSSRGCFARATLVDQDGLRAGDDRIHGAAREARLRAWWRESSTLSPEHPRRTVADLPRTRAPRDGLSDAVHAPLDAGQIGPVRDEGDAFTIEVVLSRNEDRSASRPTASRRKAGTIGGTESGEPVRGPRDGGRRPS